jgi:hypothetical protein
MSNSDTSLKTARIPVMTLEQLIRATEDGDVVRRMATALREELGDYPTDGGWMREGGVRGEQDYVDLAHAALNGMRDALREGAMAELQQFGQESDAALAEEG